MKKILALFSAIVLGVVLFTSCDINSLPEFNDKDAYIAFNSGSANAEEDAGTIKIPVYLVSKKGLSGTATYEFVDGTAKKGINYNPISSGALTFSGREGDTQYIEVQIINKPDVYTGNLSFRINLTGVGGVNLGARSSFTVTIVDLNHPLTRFFGNWQASIDDTPAWSLTVSPDKNKDNTDMLWFSQFSGIENTRIYGTINANHTEVRFPIGRELTVSVPGEEEGEEVVVATYTLIGWRWSVEKEIWEPIPEGGNVVFSINGDSSEMSCADRYALVDSEGNQGDVYENVVFMKQ